MKKIIPIITLCLAILTAILSVVGLTVISISVSVAQVRLVAVPVAIVGLTASTLLTPFAFLFKKDVLCRIAFGVDLAAFVLSVISVIIWLAIL